MKTPCSIDVVPGEPGEHRRLTPPARLALRWIWLLLIAGYLLFSHLGCHRDDDLELLAPSVVRAVLAAE
jgi:hypothetical protein